MKFQSKNGLDADGIVGPSTWESIGIDTDQVSAAEETEYTTKDGLVIDREYLDKDEYVRLGNPTTQRDVSIERRVLESQGGGCQIALGVCVQQGNLHFFEEGAGYLSFSCNDMSESEIMKQIKDFYR